MPSEASPKTRRIRAFFKKPEGDNPFVQKVLFIHDDKLSSAVGGNKTSPKVSDIRHDDTQQEWYAVLRDGREIFRHKDRNAVVRGEADAINKMFASMEWVPGGVTLVPPEVPEFFHSLVDRKLVMPLGRYCDGVHMFALKENMLPFIVVTKGLASMPTAIFQTHSARNAMINLREGQLPKGVDFCIYSPSDSGALHECARRVSIEQTIQQEESRK